MPGGADLLVAARTALLDALEALADHREALVLVGAQAVYLHTGNAPVALAEATKDSDLAIDPRILDDEPLLDRVMRSAGFHLDVTRPQPGGWLSRSGIPVDLMVPEALAGPGKRGRRGARIPPHANASTRRTPGLEAAVVDHAPMTVTALERSDARSIEIAVAGPSALLVSKLHKLAERVDDPGRLVDKDAHDVYRLLVATDTAELADTLTTLTADELAGPITTAAVEHLAELFGRPDALGATMAGRAEELVGDPAVVAAAVALLADDVLVALER